MAAVDTDQRATIGLVMTSRIMLIAPFDFGQRKFLLGAVRNHVSVAGIEYAEAETIIAGNQCAARSCSIEMADGRTDHFHSFCSGQKVTQELKTSMKGKLGPRIASTIRSAKPLGSPENPRAT